MEKFAGIVHFGVSNMKAGIPRQIDALEKIGTRPYLQIAS